jgi:hypothetical protein
VNPARRKVRAENALQWSDLAVRTGLGLGSRKVIHAAIREGWEQGTLKQGGQAGGRLSSAWRILEI